MSLKRNRWFALGALAVGIVGFLVLAGGGIGKNLVYYWSPSDIRKAGPKAIGATIRLGGLVAPGSVVSGNGASKLEFDVTDGKATVHVKAESVPPQMFRDGIGVVVEGTMNAGGDFESSRLMVSHNNEYQAPPEGGKVDLEKMMESMKP
ncbi:MAG TPA: cytochrome c maturation protein CcmE [Thermoanaerobaculia bacterium]